VVTGLGEAGAALVACPDIDKIIFTGSPEVNTKPMARGDESAIALYIHIL
jgi:acyl-CoA reductase-like NAD-dependent aldehyde dehydrogenase